MYNGTYWVWLGHGSDSNTTYSKMTTAEIDTPTGTTGRIIAPVDLKYAIDKYAGGGGASQAPVLETLAVSGSSVDIFDSNYNEAGSAQTNVYALDGGGARFDVYASIASAFSAGDYFSTDDTTIQLTKAQLVALFPDAMQAYEDTKTAFSGTGQVQIEFFGPDKVFFTHRGIIIALNCQLKMLAGRYSVSDPWEEYDPTCGIYVRAYAVKSGGADVSGNLSWNPISYRITEIH